MDSEILREFGSSTTPEILNRTIGTRERRMAAPGQMGSDMMGLVGMQILEESGISAESIDKLICSCDPQDQATPDAAVITQYKLGLSCPAFGVSMSCSAWLCGLSIAAGFIRNGDRRVLVLASSTVGSRFSFKNPMHRAIFGDGAGGSLLEVGNEGAEILALELTTRGEFHKEIFGAHQWSIIPQEVPDQFKNAFYMSSDNRVFYKAIDEWVKPFYLSLYERAGISENAISMFIVHQASMPLFDYTLKSLKIPRERVADFYAEYGNTVSAELPIVMDRYIRNGMLKRGDLVYLLTYGAGFTAGAMILRM
jgi:3-oxoacyl-[acyl-carrier-protein] synthase-3